MFLSSSFCLEWLQKCWVNDTIIHNGVKREETLVANLLETIARRLLGVGEPKRTASTTNRTAPKTTYATTSAKQPMQETPAGDWVKNSTIEEPKVEPVIAYDRTFKRERTNREVGREDLLLNQIDEFREKAQQLQSLLLSKESKVAELQNIVDEREGKARELESILSERQRQADSISVEVTKQIDALIGKVSAKMDEIGNSITSSVNESVGKELTESRQLTEKQVEELNELRELLETLTPQLETVKAELSDKIHTENVKCYRNILDLFKSMEEKMETVDEVYHGVSTVRKCSVVIIIIGIINMLGLAAFALYELGVFQLLLGE